MINDKKKKKMFYNQIILIPIAPCGLLQIQ